MNSFGTHKERTSSKFIPENHCKTLVSTLCHSVVCISNACWRIHVLLKC